MLRERAEDFPSVARPHMMPMLELLNLRRM